MELGIFSFVERTPDPQTGKTASAQERLRRLIEEVELADQLGLDVFGIGEHHREDYVVSSPAVVLAAAAARTSRIRLTSAVSVLGSNDPVRVFQDFATIDLLSGGRAEIMVGRGSFVESFPLFGYDLRSYDALFSEKLDLLLRLREAETITWTGRYRPSIDGRGIYPRPVQDPIPVWIAVGGTPESAIRTGTMGLPMALGIIGGLPERFAPFAELHRRAATEAGHPRPLLSINSHGYLAESDEMAIGDAFGPYAQTMNKIGKERGWPAMSREQFEESAQVRGANFIGSPDRIIEKILFQHRIFGHDRFLLQITVGSFPHEKVMRAIELFATRVAPAVRKALAEPESTGAKDPLASV
jgi:probable LLM family oxidoreductase